MRKQTTAISGQSENIETKPPRFNRVELLVTIALASALVGCTEPALKKAQSKAKQSKAMQNASTIGRALREFSIEQEGVFPSGDTANAAFAHLVPEMGTEDPFYVRGSAWHGRGRLADGPDNLWGEDEGDGEPLEPGENHWAYNNATAEDSAPSLPMIADGFSNQVGTYSTDPSELGGVWGGRSAIVVRCDYSVKIVRLDQYGKFTNPKANDRDEFTRHGVEMVNPAKPSG